MTTPNPPDSDDLRFARALLRLDSKLLGFVMGVILALIIFVATNWLVVMGGHVDDQGETVVGPHLALLGKFFIGYKVTFLGSLVGAFYGFAVGTIIGAAISTLYNKLTTLRKPPHPEDDSKS